MQLLKTFRRQYPLAIALACSCWCAQAFQSAPAPVFPTVVVKVKGEDKTDQTDKSKGDTTTKAGTFDNPPSAQSAPPPADTANQTPAAPPPAPAPQTSPAKPAVAKPADKADKEDEGWTSFSAKDGAKAAPDKAADPSKVGPVDQSDTTGEAYILGPQDTVNVRVVDMDEMGKEPFPIDLRGNLTLPRIGRLHAAGKTVEQLESELTVRYKEYLQEPVVSVSVAEFHSQPISVLGAVESPGVHQIKGSKSLFEVVSEAGGLREDAGNTITITRKMENGKLPLPNATTDASGKYSVADLNIRSVMSARNPGENIAVKPYDVITIPKADLIYVIGSVKRPGGFPLQERANMTVLEALALAQGLDRTAAGGRAKILRTDESTHSRTEIPIDVKKVMEGKVSDTALLANDILFIPTSNGKVASYRALEALVSTGTGIAIYRP